MSNFILQMKIKQTKSFKVQLLFRQLNTSTVCLQQQLIDTWQASVLAVYCKLPIVFTYLILWYSTNQTSSLEFQQFNSLFLLCLAAYCNKFVDHLILVATNLKISQYNIFVGLFKINQILFLQNTNWKIWTKKYRNV